MIFDIVEEMSEVVRAMPINHRKHKVIRLVAQAILQNLAFISRHPTTLFQCVWNCGLESETDGVSFDSGQFGTSIEVTEDPNTDAVTELSSLLASWTGIREARRTHPAWMRSLLPSLNALGKHFITVLTGHQNSVTALAVSPDEGRIASASRDGTIVLWESKTFKTLATIQISHVKSAGFSPDGNNLAVALANGDLKTLCGWTLDQQSTVCLSQVSLCCVSWLSNQHLVAGDEHGVARIWSVNQPTLADEADFALLAVEDLRLSGHEYRNITKDCFSGLFDDSDRHFSSPHWRTRYAILDLDVCQNSEKLVLITNDRRIHICNVTKSAIRIVKSLKCSLPLRAVRFETDTTFITAHQNGTCCCWHVTTGEQLEAFALQSNCSGMLMRALSAFCNDPTGQTRFLAFENEWWVCRNDRRSSKAFQTYSGHAWTVRAMAYMPSRGILITGSEDATVRLWDCNDSNSVVSSRRHEDPGLLTTAAVSSCGGLIVTGAKDGRVKLWDGETGRHLHTWVCQYYPVAIRFSEDERWIIVAEWEADTWVYDVNTYDVLKIIDRADADEWLEEYFGSSDCLIHEPPFAVTFTAHETTIMSNTDKAPVCFLPFSSPKCLMSANGRTLITKSGRDASFFRLEHS